MTKPRQTEWASLRDGERGSFTPCEAECRGELHSAWQGVPGTSPPSSPSGTATRRATRSGEEAGKGTGPFPHMSPHRSFPPSRSGKIKKKKRSKKRAKKALNLLISKRGATGKEWPRRGKSRGGIKGALLPRSLLFLLLLHSGTEFKWIFYSSVQLNRGSMPESCRAASADMLWARYYNFHNALLCSFSLLR